MNDYVCWQWYIETLNGRYVVRFPFLTDYQETRIYLDEYKESK